MDIKEKFIERVRTGAEEVPQEVYIFYIYINIIINLNQNIHENRKFFLIIFI